MDFYTLTFARSCGSHWRLVLKAEVFKQPIRDLKVNGHDICFTYISGPGCSKLKTLLVNFSLKFQMLISEICHYFFVEKMREAFAVLKKCEKLLQCKSFCHYINKKYQCIWL